MRRTIALSLGLVGLVCLGACRYEYTWTQSQKSLPPEQGDNCFFEIVRELPGEGFVELAEFSASRHVNDTPRTEQGLRESIEKEVCRLGGKVVVTHLNPSGHYTRGKVYVRTDDDSL